MRGFKNILFLADGSKGQQSALNRAAELAKENHAKLTLIDAVELEELGFFDSKTNKEVTALHKAQLQERLDQLKQLCEKVVSKYPRLRVRADIYPGNLVRAVVFAVLGKRACSQNDQLLGAHTQARRI